MAPRAPSALLLLAALLSPVTLGAHDLPPSFACDASSSSPSPPKPGAVVVVGSVNVDLTIRVARPPRLEETVTATSPSVAVAVGGKAEGLCEQALDRR
jgi:hypothetical protein